MSELGKPFLKNQIKKQKKTENQFQNAARENKKPLVRYVILILTKKLGPEWAVNGLGKLVRKKTDPKNRKNSKKSE